VFRLFNRSGQEASRFHCPVRSDPTSYSGKRQRSQTRHRPQRELR